MSTGILPVSARAIKIKASSAKAIEGLNTDWPLMITCAICEREVDLLARDIVKIAISIAGSASDAIVISRLDPMPPKAVPISIPASAVKNRAIAKSATITMTSAVAARGRSTDNIGMMPPARTAVPNTR